MYSRPTISIRLLVSVLVLIGLSAVLIWMMPDDALARPIFQSPQLTPTATLTAAITATRAVTATRPATLTVTASVPITAPTPVNRAVEATATLSAPVAPGFLPPPTLSAPASKLQPLLPGPGQPLVAPPAPTLAPRPASATADSPLLARLIDESIVALSYLWLCCGVFVLVVAALVIVWLARRSKRV